jgi:hypothetical protein
MCFVAPPLHRPAAQAALVPARVLRWLVPLWLAGAATLAQAQAAAPDFQEQGNALKYSATPVRKLVLANAKTQVGVSLERLTLLSGEGNMDKKVTSAVLAGAFTLIGMRSGSNVAAGVDFADREPIHEHLTVDDATKISQEAVAIVLDKLRAAGVEVAGPDVVAAAPFYAKVEGDTAVGTDTAHQDGGLFKKSYHYGFYNLPVAGLKYRKPGMFEAMGNEDLYPLARSAAQAGGALDLSLSFYNDKKVFGLFDFTARIWGQVQGRNSDMPMFAQVLKNKDDYTVPSGGKDAYVYWLAFKPQFETLASALADRVAKALASATAGT